LGRTEEAQEWLTKALELDPASAEAHTSLALSRLTSGDLRGAMEHARAVEELESLTPQELLQYGSLRENLDALLSSPLADALMQQADLAGDEESANMNREMADMLGGMQRSLALTQYLR